MVVHGIVVLVPMPQEVDTYRYYNGVVPMVAHGIVSPVMMPDTVATWMYYNGHWKMVVQMI
jgi:hypothetical protein